MNDWVHDLDHGQPEEEPPIGGKGLALARLLATGVRRAPPPHA